MQSFKLEEERQKLLASYLSLPESLQTYVLEFATDSLFPSVISRGGWRHTFHPLCRRNLFPLTSYHGFSIFKGFSNQLEMLCLSSSHIYEILEQIESIDIDSKDLSVLPSLIVIHYCPRDEFSDFFEFAYAFELCLANFFKKVLHLTVKHFLRREFRSDLCDEIRPLEILTHDFKHMQKRLTLLKKILPSTIPPLQSL